MGGAIYIDVDASLTLINSTLSGYSATSGGGAINNSGTLTVSNCNITANAALLGGGIFNDFDGKLTLKASTLSRNTATNHGGSIGNIGTLTLLSVE